MIDTAVIGTMTVEAIEATIHESDRTAAILAVAMIGDVTTIEVGEIAETTETADLAVHIIATVLIMVNFTKNNKYAVYYTSSSTCRCRS